MPPSKGGRKRPRVTADMGAAAVTAHSTLPHHENEDYQVGAGPVVDALARV